MSIILQYKLPPLETKTNGKKKKNKKNIYTSPTVYNVLTFKAKEIFCERSWSQTLAYFRLTVLVKTQIAEPNPRIPESIGLPV